MLKILRYMCMHESKKSSMCQNNQNFMHANNIKAHMHMQMQKSSTCQNDQNFMHVKNIKACACTNEKKDQCVKMIRISHLLKTLKCMHVNSKKNCKKN